MRVRRDERFEREAAAYRFRHCCEDCAYFDVPSGRCCHEWPNEEHRRAFYEQPGEEVVFCKEFELL